MIRMKAWILHQINHINLEERNVPVPGENEVLVHVRAAGICGSDIPRIYQDGAHHMPLIPGHEFAGEVVQLGTGVNRNWISKRVGVFPLIPCLQCPACQNQQFEMCSHYNYLGSRRDGGFAEYVAVPERNLIELPDNVSFEEAAMLEPMAVAVHAMRRLESTSADIVAVYGLGTIGILLAAFLFHRGVKKVLVIGNKEFQKQAVIRFGLPEQNFCDSKTQNVKNWISNQTNGRGVDLFFECVGKNETLLHAIEYTASAGSICLVGNPHTDMVFPKEIYWMILRRQLTITGTWNSSFTGQKEDDWHYVLDLLRRKQIEPEWIISHTVSLTEMNKGLHIMKEKSEDYIKIMLTNY